jgi:hypothetical protein
MQRFSFDSAIEQLHELDDWLHALGIRVQKDRWHDAIRMLHRAKEQRDRVERGVAYQPIPNYFQGLFEALEVLQIFRAFSNDTSPLLKEKLSRALSGPVSPLEEQPKNSAARNAMFELALAAGWKNAGAIVQLGEPDICLTLGAATFVVECKRPFSSTSVRRNIEDAAGQLRRALDAPGQTGSFGIVAVSVSRVFSPSNLMCATKDQGRAALNEALIELIGKHRYEWKWNTAAFHERIASVMFHLAVPWDIGGEKLIHLSTTKFFEQTKCVTGFQVLRENISELYPA